MLKKYDTDNKVGKTKAKIGTIATRPEITSSQADFEAAKAKFRKNATSDPKATVDQNNFNEAKEFSKKNTKRLESANIQTKNKASFEFNKIFEQDNLDLVSKLSGHSSLSSPQTENIRGYNANLGGVPAPKNQDSFGMTFFTRPDLNLSYDNIIGDRILSLLHNTGSTSMSSILKDILDPQIYSKNVDPEENERRNNSIFSFQNSGDTAFIPLLTNNLVSMSGWPDIAPDTYTSREGIYKESWGMIDGTSELYGHWDISANFRNIQGDPITMLLLVWIRYASLVFDGTIMPKMHNLLYNRIDYTTRIYRLVLNKEFTYVQKIACTGGSFPVAVPIGAAFNYSEDSELNNENDNISIRFNCIGACYMDAAIIREFNQTVQIFNDKMTNGRRQNEMVCLHPDTKLMYKNKNYSGIYILLINALNFNLHPRINELTLAFEWWVNKELFESVMVTLIKNGII